MAYRNFYMRTEFYMIQSQVKRLTGGKASLIHQ